MFLKVHTFFWILIQKTGHLKKKKTSFGECNVFSAFQETLDVGLEIVYGSFSAFHPMT